MAPRRTVPGSSCLWAPAVALFSRELLLRRSLLPNPLPRGGSILGKISARGESRELISREDGRRLLFAGSGTATTGASAGAATGAGVQRHGPPSARPGRGCRETPAGAALSLGARSCPLPGSPRSLRRVQQLQLTGAARAGVCGGLSSRTCAAASARSPPAWAGDEGRGAGVGAGGGTSGPPPRPAAVAGKCLRRGPRSIGRS